MVYDSHNHDKTFKFDQLTMKRCVLCESCYEHSYV